MDVIDHDDEAAAAARDAKPRGGPRIEDFGAAAVLALPFMIVFMIMRYRYPPTEASYTHADPILKLLPREPMMWLTPLFGVALTVVLLVLAWPSWKIMGRALMWGAIGAVVAAGAMALMWKLHGSRLPRLFALEEGNSGLTYGPMTAYLEEILIRVSVLPLIYLHMTGRSRALAVIGASLITSLIFAILHEAGSSEAFAPTTFAIRFALPGLVLCLMALLLKPSVSVTFHGVVHVMVPLLFIA